LKTELTKSEPEPIAYQEFNANGDWFLAYTVNKKAKQVPLYFKEDI
jgi:hypothetical protein